MDCYYGLSCTLAYAELIDSVLLQCYLFSILGSKFLCSVLVAPVKNEEGEIILFILNLEDITNAPLKSSIEHNGDNVMKTSK